MTHKDELLVWFSRGLTITPAKAVDQFNNYRLADTVYNLRADGHTITTEILHHTNMLGRNIRYARYTYNCGPSKEDAA